jgi:hypothetical protein
MESQDTMPQVYKELADWYDRRAELSMRDRFLVLAMDAAHRAGHRAETEKLRHRLLQVSPHHMLRPFASFEEALQAPDVQTYLRDLRMNYPSEVAQVLLRSLRSNANRQATESPAAAPDINATLDPFKAFPAPKIEPNGKFPPFLEPAAPIPLRVEPAPARPVAKAGKRTQSSQEPWQPKGATRKPPASGGWLGIVLFVVLFFAGIAVAGYVAARPFVPEVVNAVRIPVVEK